MSVTEVCFAVGCGSLGTFSTRFTELVGVPPSVYREQAAGATAGIPSCVEIVQEPTDQPYGVRDCALRDPAGNLLRIQQRG